MTSSSSLREDVIEASAALHAHRIDRLINLSVFTGSVLLVLVLSVQFWTIQQTRDLAGEAKSQSVRNGELVIDIEVALKQHHVTVAFERQILSDVRALLRYDVTLCRRVPGCHQSRLGR